MPPTTLPAPDHDPDGLQLMASLRARTAGHSESSRAKEFRPALFAVCQLALDRRNAGASQAELQRLEAIQRDLQALARGI
jgi:hypothetical protein